jgi:hypothetical protein
MNQYRNTNNRLPTDFGSADNTEHLFQSYLSEMDRLGVVVDQDLSVALKQLAKFTNIYQGLNSFLNYPSDSALRMSDSSNRLEIAKEDLPMVIPLMNNGIMLAMEAIEGRIEDLIGEDNYEEFQEVLCLN